MHESVIVERLLEDREELESCTKCGALIDSIEPDADDYDCEDCGAKGTVQGSMNIRMALL